MIAFFAIDVPDRSGLRADPKYLTDAFEWIWVLLYFTFILELDF